MRLKSLELNGYKTFASQTVFEFAGAVTAIVGPNGSGKSNVADGLRWVLGEQTYSLMRAKRTEDMIYAGSQFRSRSGMASVTVVLDNQDGWLPVDYSEVAIARRAYRDGLNEYLLNKQRVRLRDISELLAKCGLAERTYTIIGQGLVDAALALKAEERRRLFEEAAGIGLYRARREDALRRLDITHRNLDRVQDILAELEPRLKSLERQAQRANEYNRIKSDLRSLLREWYGYHWLRVQTELVGSQESVKQQEKELEETRYKQTEYARQLNSLRDQAQNIRHNLTQWHRQLAELHFQRESTSKNLAVIQERLRSLEEQRLRTKNSFSHLEEDIKQHKDRWETAAKELEVKETELSDARLHLETSKAELREYEQKQADLMDRLGSTRLEYEVLLDRLSYLQGQFRDFQEILKRLSTELDDFEEEIERSQKHHINLKTELQKSEGLVKNAHKERHKVEELWKAHQIQVDKLKANRLLLVSELGQQKIELDSLKAKVDILNQSEQKLTGYASGARLLIEAARDHRLFGVKGSLNSLLEVPQKFETAIASVLGNFLDAVVVEKEENLDQALSLLEHETARGALLSADQIKPMKLDRINDRRLDEINLSESRAILGIAADLVETKNELRSLVDFLMGNVLVVEDRRAAVQTISELNGLCDGLFNAGVVTLQGEFYTARGAVLIGREAQSGILGRQRIKRELIMDLETSEGKSQLLLGELEELDSKLAEQISVTDNIGIMREKAEAQERELKRAYEQLGLEVNQANQQLSWLEKQRGIIDAEINQKRAEMMTVSEKLAQIQAKISKQKSLLNQKDEQLEKLSLDDAKTKLNYWETKAAVADQACLDATKLVSERKEFLKRAQEDFRGLQDRLDAFDETISNLETEKDGLITKELEISQTIDQQKSLIEPAENDLQIIEAKQEELQRAEGEARVALNMAEHRNAQAKIALAKSQEMLSSLRRRIEDDFGLVELEYSTEISGPKPLPLEGLVEQLPLVKILNPEVEENLKRQRSLLRRIGPINPEAETEYIEVKDRYGFLKEQLTDLGEADADIRQIIVELDKLMEKAFRDTFESVAVEFRKIFIRLFGGGSARLILTDPDDLNSSGIDIEARLPGRREQGLALLSGGERSLAAVALVFALLKVSPTPFCILDEVDAMLDEGNVNRFSDLLKELSSTTQFIIITHNPNTLQVADVIYGVTMGKDSSSKIVSLKPEKYEEAQVR